MPPRPGIRPEERQLSPASFAPIPFFDRPFPALTSLAGLLLPRPARPCYSRRSEYYKMQQQKRRIIGFGSWSVSHCNGPAFAAKRESCKIST